ILRYLVQRDQGLIGSNGGFPFRPPFGTLLRKLPLFLFVLFFPDKARAQVLARTQALVQAVETQADAVRGLERRQRFIEEMLPRFGPEMMGRGLPLLFGAGLASLYLAQTKLQAWLGDATALQPVRRALPHNPTTEMDLALWNVSQRLKKEVGAPSAQHPAVKAFLARYGHRAAREIDVGVARWREEPTPILDILRTYLTHGPELDPELHFRQGVEQADETVAKLIQRVRREKGKLRASFLSFLLRRARALA